MYSSSFHIGKKIDRSWNDGTGADIDNRLVAHPPAPSSGTVRKPFEFGEAATTGSLATTVPTGR
jgi:hypothetical protein